MIEGKVHFNTIRYSNCWEDADILLEALDIKKEGNYLSIAASGDNALALLAKNPNRVVAFDINPAQLALLELKKISFEYQSYPNVLKFLGVSKATDRITTYLMIKDYLSEQAREFWDSHLTEIQNGVIHSGRFENYFSLFRKWVLPCIHRKKKRDLLLSEMTLEKRTQFYETSWNTFRWNLLFKFFFGRKMMGDVGRDPEFFRYIEKNVGSSILNRVKKGLTDLPTHDNPYLRYILRGNFEAGALPFYLREENFASIRQNLSRLEIFEGNLDDVLSSHRDPSFDGYNLSDIFEYMSVEEYASALTHILKQSSPNARIVYWNMLAARKEVSNLPLQFLDDIANDLYKKDKAFFYQSFVIGSPK